jgi:hypothetical protein
MSIKRLAILDDYQGVAMSMGPWDRLKGVEVTVFRDTITDRDALVQRLAPFDAILAMRERTPFPRALIERCRISACWSPPRRATARSTRRPAPSAASSSAARPPTATRRSTSPGG